jgi:mono/diheme cytochrome c family protein
MNWKIKATVLSTALMFAAPAAFGDAAAVYTKHCASCHGADGKGQTTMGKKQKVGDYTDPAVQAKFSDDEALKVILEGKGKMKGYKDKVSEAEAKDLVKFIRAFKK